MKLEEVTDNYDNVAKHYDAWTDIIFNRILGVEHFRQIAIERLGDIRGKVVLDIGCGTGKNFPCLVSRIGASGRIIGVDYSAGMLERARNLVAKNGWDNVELRLDDAAKLDSVGEHVDAAISVWTMGIVHDMDAALNRAIDVLCPSGRLAIMDFDRARPDHGILRWLYPAYSALLQWAGIDSAEDLDDTRLRAKWASGRAILYDHLKDGCEERYLSDMGIIISGSVPKEKS